MSWLSPSREYLARPTEQSLVVRPTAWVYLWPSLGLVVVGIAGVAFSVPVAATSAGALAAGMIFVALMSIGGALAGTWMLWELISTTHPQFDKQSGLFHYSTRSGSYQVRLQDIRAVSVHKEGPIRVDTSSVPGQKWYETVYLYNVVVSVVRSIPPPVANEEPDGEAVPDSNRPVQTFIESVKVSADYESPERPRELAREIADFLEVPGPA